MSNKAIHASASEALIILERTDALRRGHFVLSSGLHSDRYCQCARVLEYPDHAARLATLMADRLHPLKADTVLAPALGGIVWGFTLAGAIGARSLFAERAPGEQFALRRGFELKPRERVLLAEDVVTTGGSVMELVPLVESAGASVVGFSAIADRSAGRFLPSCPFHALVQLDFQTYQPDACPMCRAGTPIEKPGSRRDAACGDRT